MRTVHETEALRPSDPVPKHHSSNPQNRSQRIKLTFNKWSANSNASKDDDTSAGGQRSRKASPASPTIPDAEYEKDFVVWSDGSDGWVPHFPADVTMTQDELAYGAKAAYKLFKQQLQWAEAEGAELDRQIEILERRRQLEWAAKETLLADLLSVVKDNMPVAKPKTRRIKVEEHIAQSLENDADDTMLPTHHVGDGGESIMSVDA